MPTVGLLAIFQNEALIMREWVLHHRLEGISQFVLIDDRSTDGGAALASSLGSDVTVVPSRGASTQEESYHAWAHLLSTEWMLVVDLDEFVYARPQPGEPQPTIPQFLAMLDDSVGAIVLPWVMFASSGLPSHPASVVNASRVRAPAATREQNVKTLSRRSALCNANASFKVHTALTSGAHCLATAPPDCAQTTWQPISYTPSCVHGMSDPNLGGMIVYNGALPVAGARLQLNHYPLQSWEYFCRVKMTRGDVSAPSLDHFRDGHYYNRYHEAALGARDDELATKRGAAFLAALLPAAGGMYPRSTLALARAWPPASNSSECVGAAPSVQLLFEEQKRANEEFRAQWTWLLVLVFVLAVLLCLLLYWHLRRRRQKAEEKEPPPPRWSVRVP